MTLSTHSGALRNARAARVDYRFVRVPRSVQPNYTLRLALALALAFGVVGPVAAQDHGLTSTPERPEAAAQQPKKEVAVRPGANDAQIASRLQGILAATGWFIAPKVTSREGVVFIDAITRNQAHKTWATNLAESTEDVVAVVNRIEVRPEVQWDFSFVQRDLHELYWQAARSLPLVLLASIILAVFWSISVGVAMLARRGLRHRIPSPLLLKFTTRAMAIPVFLLGLYFVLRISNLTGLALTVLGGTGIVGIVIGFASRDIVENFLASFFLSLQRPFRTGDYITVSGIEGVVQSLNTRSTVLLTLDGALVQIPNGMIFKDKITNLSTTPSRRSEFMVGIGYDSSIARAQELIREVLTNHPGVLPSPEPLVLVDSLGAATVNLRCLYWFASKTYSPIKIRSALLRQIKGILQEQGISMPDATREVIFPNGVPVHLLESDAAQTRSRRKAKRALPPAEQEESATGAEGGLTSEQSEIKTTLSAAQEEVEGENLLSDRSSSS